ncbi:MAG TPA: hypothetical protein VM264_00675 [Acidimicrobiales bacterium]|nr:hypothetical protein [Acidimicrobiales bacterium]
MGTAGDRFEVSARRIRGRRLAWSAVRNLAGLAAFHDASHQWPPMDVVVTDRVSGLVVSTIPTAGACEASLLVDRVQQDLDALEVGAFSTAWGIDPALQAPWR